MGKTSPSACQMCLIKIEVIFFPILSSNPTFQKSIMSTQNNKKTWQLSWNKKNYNYDKLMKSAASSEKHRTITQSWGKTSTANISKIGLGDEIYISCASKCIMKAVVTRAFYESTDVKTDEFVINSQEHVERNANKWYCQLYISEIYFDEYQRDLCGNQNTFCNPRNAFWKK